MYGPSILITVKEKCVIPSNRFDCRMLSAFLFYNELDLEQAVGLKQTFEEVQEQILEVVLFIF